MKYVSDILGNAVNKNTFAKYLIQEFQMSQFEANTAAVKYPYLWHKQAKIGELNICWSKILQYN